MSPTCGRTSARVRSVLLAALAAGLAAWPWVAPRYFVFLASLILVNVVVALGLNLLSGYTNQLSFGHAGFLAIGAYTAALVAIHAPGVPVLLTLLAAGAATAATASRARRALTPSSARPGRAARPDARRGSR